MLSLSKLKLRLDMRGGNLDMIENRLDSIKFKTYVCKNLLNKEGSDILWEHMKGIW